LKRKIWITITIIWVAFIFYNSTRTGYESSNASGIFVNTLNFLLNKININIDLNTLSLIIRKGAHFFEYFILAIFSYNIVKTYDYKKGKILYDKVSIFSYLIVLIFCVLIAASDEFVQGFISGRARSLFDVVIDFLGSFFAIFSIIIFNLKKIKSTLNNKQNL